MTGPDHYRAAEGILKDALKAAADGATDVSEYIAVAQVHATLSLAAATALVAGDDGRTGLSDYDAWSEVASTAAAERRKNGAPA